MQPLVHLPPFDFWEIARSLPIQTGRGGTTVTEPHDRRERALSRLLIPERAGQRAGEGRLPTLDDRGVPPARSSPPWTSTRQPCGAARLNSPDQLGVASNTGIIMVGGQKIALGHIRVRRIVVTAHVAVGHHSSTITVTGRGPGSAIAVGRRQDHAVTVPEAGVHGGGCARTRSASGVAGSPLAGCPG